MVSIISSKRDLSEKVGEQVRIFRRDTIWTATYQLHGRQKRTSLKTSNKKNAVKLALEIDRRLATGESPAPPDNCTIAAAIAAYDECLVAERRSAKTLNKYRFVLRFAEKLAERLGRSLLSQLDLPFVDKYRVERAKSCSPKTIYTEVVIVRQLVKFGLTRRMIADDPLLGMRIPKPKPTHQPCFEPEQIEQILEFATDAHRPTFLLLAETGLRFGEATWLTWQDIDFKRNVIHVRSKDGWRSKTGDERAVPMSLRLAIFLKSHSRRARWVLTAMPTSRHPDQGRQISERRALAALKRILKRLEIAGKLHTFRHAFISRCLTLGIEESVVRSWVGHVDPAIMRLYTHISSKVSQERIQRLTPDVGCRTPDGTTDPKGKNLP